MGEYRPGDGGLVKPPQKSDVLSLTQKKLVTKNRAVEVGGFAVLEKNERFNLSKAFLASFKKQFINKVKEKKKYKRKKKTKRESQTIINKNYFVVFYKKDILNLEIIYTY